MNEKNKEKLNKLKLFLDKQNIFYSEYPNGQLKIDSINVWATTETFYDEETKFKGKGVNNLLNYYNSKLANNGVVINE